MSKRTPTPKQVTEAAMEAFWAKVVELWPDATSGDLSPGATLGFEFAASEAVADFQLNLPGFADEDARTEHEHIYRRDIADWWCVECNTAADRCQQLDPT
jgi:hypothetical protein